LKERDGPTRRKSVEVIGGRIGRRKLEGEEGVARSRVLIVGNGRRDRVSAGSVAARAEVDGPRPDRAVGLLEVGDDASGRDAAPARGSR
jgi:hypothetical protein